MKRIFLAIMLVLTTMTASAQAEDPIKGNLATHLQDISVTIKSNSGQGSGVIFTRELEDKSGEKVKVNFVWTAAHVVDGLRSTRRVIDHKGQYKQVIEFKDAGIVKELVQNGRRVGEVQMDAKVIKYSDAENGEDLALLMIRKHGFVDVSTKFHLDEPKIIPIGTKLFHVGSLRGQVGSNSMTAGIMSQVGRVISLGKGDGVIFDQTTVTAFPGSSGGGVYIAGAEDDMKKHRGQYCGMLVRGSGETFNLIVPIRRMKWWAKSQGVLWAMDPKVEPPKLSDIKGQRWVIDDAGGVDTKAYQEAVESTNKRLGLHFLLGEVK